MDKPCLTPERPKMSEVRRENDSETVEVSVNHGGPETSLQTQKTTSDCRREKVYSSTSTFFLFGTDFNVRM